MQFSINKALFSDSIAWAARILPLRPASPILAGIKIETTGPDAIVVSAFDYEISARQEIAADVEMEGAVLVAGKLLADIAKALPGETVQCRTNGGKLEIVSGNSKYSLQEMPLSDYPRLPQIPPTVGTITADDFRTLVNKVAFSAANREEANPIFTGARLDISGPELSLVATDKVRLALYSAKWDSPGVESAAPVVVKARVLQDVARSLVAESSDVEIGLAVDGGINVISFTNGPRVTTSQLIDGGYPNVLGLFADSYPIQVSVAREALISALKRVALVSEREVLLKFRQGEVELVAGQGEEANASEMLPSTLNGEDITIALRPSFLLDGLGALTKDFASLNLTHPIKPVEVRGRDSVAGEDDESFRYLFVPIRIAG